MRKWLNRILKFVPKCIHINLGLVRPCSSPFIMLGLVWLAISLNEKWEYSGCFFAAVWKINDIYTHHILSTYIILKLISRLSRNRLADNGCSVDGRLSSLIRCWCCTLVADTSFLYFRENFFSKRKWRVCLIRNLNIFKRGWYEWLHAGGPKRNKQTI